MKKKTKKSLKLVSCEIYSTKPMIKGTLENGCRDANLTTEANVWAVIWVKLVEESELTRLLRMNARTPIWRQRRKAITCGPEVRTSVRRDAISKKKDQISKKRDLISKKRDLIFKKRVLISKKRALICFLCKKRDLICTCDMGRETEKNACKKKGALC